MPSEFCLLDPDAVWGNSPGRRAAQEERKRSLLSQSHPSGEPSCLPPAPFLTLQGSQEHPFALKATANCPPLSVLSI